MFKCIVFSIFNIIKDIDGKIANYFHDNNFDGDLINVFEVPTDSSGRRGIIF